MSNGVPIKVLHEAEGHIMKDKHHRNTLWKTQSAPMLKSMKKKTRPKGQQWKRFMWSREEEGMGWDMETSSRSEGKINS
uniref:Uncharacterized protein n=1 Tax=Suricata suricatta TaxID=37032 RepID=A0A673VI96_SURSU